METCIKATEMFEMSFNKDLAENYRWDKLIYIDQSFYIDGTKSLFKCLI